ncbi:ABC transporter ATP-binding protein [Wukongibacter sp. M2B1]|uniref:ABC transporter ATP-binding protein n=1 Tax=Wukongibacter sp. M2B1 TaxID=3088895 RepID=UPI003D7B74AF
MENREKILQVKDLYVTFNTFSGKVHAVRGLDFDLYKGETLAIVGESGSGKSVTTKTIMGILAKNSNKEAGQVLYKDDDLLKFTEKDYNMIRGTEISMIFQDPMSSLDPVMKIGKQITEALRIKYGVSKMEAKNKAIGLMKAVGINEAEKRYNQYPFQFSGGMRQRIVIAIALACDPEVLICDEPTTALDVTIQAQILELIKDMQKERDLSVIFITHDLGVVANVADRIVVMYAGKIVEYGTTDDIFYNPKHPYTWSLLASMPDMDTDGTDELFAISGTPPNMINPPKGDAFAFRNKYAMRIDFEKHPPTYKVSDTHYAATWLLHPDAPKVDIPRILKRRIERQKKRVVVSNE